MTEGPIYVDIASSGDEEQVDYYYYHEKRKDGRLYHSKYEDLSYVKKKDKKSKEVKQSNSKVFYQEIDTPTYEQIDYDKKSDGKRKPEPSDDSYTEIVVNSGYVTTSLATPNEEKPNKQATFTVLIPKSADSKNKDDDEAELIKLIAHADGEFVKKLLIAHINSGDKLSVMREALREGRRKKKGSQNKGRVWNEEFQVLLDAKCENGISMEVMQKFSELGYDFVQSAESYAKIIVDELWIDDEHKTIKRASVGGVAGGEKYIVQGILFKFCLDQIIETKPKTVWMYGGDEPNDEYAMKVGGLEMQGLDIWQINAMPQALELRVPLMALIDYKGFRLVATSLLPIGKDSLKYGSNDGGKTVLASDPQLNELIAKVAKSINLKPHTVGKNKVLLSAPGDIEGHKGKDGRYYLLDFARTMPPEAPEFDPSGRPVIPRGVFHRMLRPELVLSNPVPLSPDVFSGWGERDENKRESQQEVIAATKRIRTECIPALVNELNALDIEAISGNFFTNKCASATHLRMLLERVSLPYRMHKKGINLRYMGLLRQEMKDEKWRRLILSLALTRIFKKDFRQALRATLRSCRTSDVAVRSLVANSLNAILRASRMESFANESEFKSATRCPVPSGKKDLDWKAELEKKFPGILSEEEKTENMSLFLSSRVSSKLIVFECLNLKMFRLTPQRMKQIATINDLSQIVICPWDILDLCTNIRFSLFTFLMKGMHLQMRARELLGWKTPVLISNEYSIETEQKNKEFLFEQAKEQCSVMLALEKNMKKLAREEMPEDEEGKEAEEEQEEEEGKVKTTKKATKKRKHKNKGKKNNIEKKEETKEEKGTENESPKTEEKKKKKKRRRKGKGTKAKKEQIVWQPKDDEGEVLPKIGLKEGRRVLKKAAGVITLSQLNYPLSPHICLLWGDVLVDIGKTHSHWPKIKACYEGAFEKFETTLSMAGPSKLLLLVWADALKDYSARAKAYGERALASKLWHEADAKFKAVRALNEGESLKTFTVTKNEQK